jgi:hypothetical protein
MQIEEMEALLKKKIETSHLLSMTVIEITRAMRKYKINQSTASCGVPVTYER